MRQNCVNRNTTDFDGGGDRRVVVLVECDSGGCGDGDDGGDGGGDADADNHGDDDHDPVPIIVLTPIRVTVGASIP